MLSFRRFFASASGPSAAMAKAQAIINKNPVAVFSKTSCPHSRAAKDLLTQKGAKYCAVELDQVADGSQIQAALREMTGQRTVPNIFIGKQHIGGNSDLQAKGAQLPALLQNAGAQTGFKPTVSVESSARLVASRCDELLPNTASGR